MIWGGAEQTDGGVFDLQTNSWEPIPPAPSEFGERRFVRSYRAYVERDHLVVVSPQMRAVTYALRDRRRTTVKGHPPAFNGVAPDLVIGDPSVVIHVGCHFAVGAIPTPECLRTGWIARVNVDASQWEVARVPERGVPRQSSAHRRSGRAIG